ncbi:MAG: flagellar export protein FliJ [Syntrophobacter sp.]
MPFRFRLNSVLRHREFKLQEARSAFAAAESARALVQSQIERTRERLHEESELLASEQETGINAARYLNFKNHLDVLERDLLKLQRELEKAANEAELKRQEMIEWNKAVELLESIETRDRESHNYLVNRKDQKKLDEAAVFKDFRDRGPGGRREEE